MIINGPKLANTSGSQFSPYNAHKITCRIVTIKIHNTKTAKKLCRYMISNKPLNTLPCNVN